MLIWSVVIGIGCGFLSGLGVGGGSLLMLWLTMIKNTAQAQARAINLIFFLASSGTVTIFRLKRGQVAVKALLPAIIAGCVSAWLFSRLGQNMDSTLLRRLYGILLVITGIRELCYRPRKLR